MDGVKEVAYFDGMGGYYQSPQNGASVMAFNNLAFLRNAPEFYTVSPEHLLAFEKLRTGAIVGRFQIDEYGWQIGDRIPITGGIPRLDGSTTWDIDIVGVWDGPADEFEERQIFIHYDYLNEGKMGDRDRVFNIFIYIDATTSDVEVGEQIDSFFLNSTAPTRTVSQRQLEQNRVERMGSVSLFINTIVGIALVIVLFSVAGTMSQSIRERLPEFAVLSSMGFPTQHIAWMAIAEAILICLLGAGIGLGTGYLLAPYVYQIMGQFPGPLPWALFAWGFAMAAGLAILASVFPIHHLHRSSTVDTLAGR